MAYLWTPHVIIWIGLSRAISAHKTSVQTNINYALMFSLSLSLDQSVALSCRKNICENKLPVFCFISLFCWKFLSWIGVWKFDKGIFVKASCDTILNVNFELLLIIAQNICGNYSSSFFHWVWIHIRGQLNALQSSIKCGVSSQCNLCHFFGS